MTKKSDERDAVAAAVEYTDAWTKRQPFGFPNNATLKVHCDYKEGFLAGVSHEREKWEQLIKTVKENYCHLTEYGQYITIISCMENLIAKDEE